MNKDIVSSTLLIGLVGATILFMAAACGSNAPGDEPVRQMGEAITGVCNHPDDQVAYVSYPATGCGGDVHVSSPDASYGSSTCEGYALVSTHGTTQSSPATYAYAEPYTEPTNEYDCEHTVTVLYSYHWTGSAWHLDYSNNATGVWYGTFGCSAITTTSVVTTGAPLLEEAAVTTSGSYVRLTEGWGTGPCGPVGGGG